MSDDDKNDTVPEPPTPTVETPVADTPEALGFYVTMSVVDEETFETLPATVQFYEGTDLSENITDLSGTSIAESISTESGTFSFKLTSDISELKVVVTPTSDEYEPTSSILDLSDADSSEVFNSLIQLTNFSTVSKGETTKSASSGNLSEAIDLSVDSDSGGTGVTIGTDVLLQDANNETIGDGDVTLSVKTADVDAAPGKKDAISLIPEGVNNDSTGTVKLPVAFSNIVMEAGDAKVKNFTPNISITSKVPSTVNGLAVSPGDVLNVSSYNEDTGEWKVEDNVTVAADNSVEISTNHLSGWGLFLSRQGMTLSPTITLNRSILGPISYRFWTPQFRYRRTVSGLTSFSIFSRPPYLHGAPSTFDNLNLTIRNFSGDIIRTQTITGLAGGQNVNVNIPTTYTTTSKDFKVTYTCSNAEVDTTKQFAFTGAEVKYSKYNETSESVVGAPTSATESSTNGGTYNLQSLVSGSKYQVSFTPLGSDDLISIGTQNFIVDLTDDSSFTVNIDRNNCVTEEVPVTGGTGSTGSTGGNG